MEVLGEDGEVDGFWQRIVLEAVPAYCSVCEKLGHTPATCRKDRREPVAEELVEPVEPEVVMAEEATVEAEVLVDEAVDRRKEMEHGEGSTLVRVVMLDWIVMMGYLCRKMISL